MKPTGEFTTYTYTCGGCGEERIGHSQNKRTCFACKQDRRARYRREHPDKRNKKLSK